MRKILKNNFNPNRSLGFGFIKIQVGFIFIQLKFFLSMYHSEWRYVRKSLYGAYIYDGCGVRRTGQKPKIIVYETIFMN